MADKEKIIRSSGSEDVFATLKRANELITRVDSGITKSNDSLKEYTSNFEHLNEVLKEYNTQAADVRRNSKLDVKIKTLESESTSESSGGGTKKKKSKEQSEEDKRISKASKAAKSLFDTFAPAKIKSLSATASNVKNLSAGMTALGAKIGLAAGGVGLLVGGVALLANRTVEANKNTIEYSRSLSQMGKTLAEYQKDSIKSANSMRDLKNKWSNFWQDLGETFIPVLNDILSLLNKIPGNSSESLKKTYGVQSNISASARQSGFTLGSANALAGGTYKAALGLSKTDLGAGLQASDIAKDLADAWLTGSDAAKQFGIVLNDNVLQGWLAVNKNIDITNVEVTEAQKQAYRYELMLEQIKQVQAGNLSGLSKYVKTWTQVGLEIDKAKGKLFSFDEVINLDAFNSDIPDIKGDHSFSGRPGDDKDNTPGIIGGLPDTPSSPTPGGSVTPGGLVDTNVKINIETVGADELQEVQENINALPEVVSVTAEAVAAPAISAIQELMANVQGIPQIIQSMIDLQIPGFSLVPQLQSYIDSLPSQVGVEVNVATAGLEYLQQALQMFEQLKQYQASFSGSFVNERPAAYSTRLKLRQISTQTAGQTYSVQGLGLGKNGLANNKKAMADSINKQKNSLGLNNNGLTAHPTFMPRSQNAQEYIKLREKEIALEKKRQREAEIHNTAIKAANNFYSGMSIGGLLAGTAGIGAGIGAAGAGVAAAAGAAGAAGSSAAGAAAGAAGAASNIINITDKLYELPAAANGGIGTREMNIRAFEGNKKEAIIPLETEAGISYLASAMNKASGGDGNTSSVGGDHYEINVNLSGLNVSDNEAGWERVGKKISEVIDVQRQRRGELSYGGSF